MSGCQMDPARLSALVDDELPGDERQAVEAHLAECPHCRSELAALRAVREGVASLAGEEPTPADWGRVWSGVERALPRPERDAAHARPRKGLAGAGRRVAWRPWLWPRPAFAAAALIILAAGLIAYGLWPHGATSAPGEFTVAGREDVRFVSVAYDCDDYTLVLMSPVEGKAPVLWVSPTEEQ